MREAEFLRELQARRDDESLRMVYADWLEEHCDPRSEFLRIESRLRQLPDEGPECQPLKRRLGELGSQCDVRWIRTVCRVHIETGPPYLHPRRCSLNVIGPFYTCGDCLCCEAPEAEAPDLLAPLRGGNYITHFVRQPQTAAEIERACRAVVVCCVADLRYGGTDPNIIARLDNDPMYCDHLLADTSPRLVAAPNEWRQGPKPQLSGIGLVERRPLTDLWWQTTVSR